MNFTCPNTVTPAATQHSATIMLVILNVSEVRDCRLKKALKIIIRKYRYQEENRKRFSPAFSHHNQNEFMEFLGSTKELIIHHWSPLPLMMSSNHIDSRQHRV